MELQQSPFYAAYLTRIGWDIAAIGEQNLFIKHFPFIGSIAKLQRVTSLPSISTIKPVFARYRVRILVAEPDSSVSPETFSGWCSRIRNFVRISSTPYLPTKTLRIPVDRTDEQIFQRFSEAKRRAVRRAQKYGVRVGESDDIDAFIRLKNESAGFLGFITTWKQKDLWQQVPRANKAILLAHEDNQSVKPLGGIFMIFWKSLAYYWIAGATRRGKKMFAPSLMVWEALKFSRARGCSQFDFVGVWDERLRAENTSWKGFTKFKEGFGGTPIYYPFYRG